MASLIPSILPGDLPTRLFLFLAVGALLALLGGLAVVLAVSSVRKRRGQNGPGAGESFVRFFYACFLKPHQDGSGSGQQAALESFYRAQADAYDATRTNLLRGREDMLGLAAAQLKRKAPDGGGRRAERIWVDIGGGTGYNIEAMSAHVSVPDFFSRVYLVDFSPSLCEVARKRFARLGWDVRVVCQDARLFRLEDYEADVGDGSSTVERPKHSGAALVTMSYSLSMIPEFYSVIDSITDLLAPAGVIGVVDFYVQSIFDVSFRNYTGGVLRRHVNWFGRLFWRAWFDVDRIGLEACRRDYLEYRFGTVLSADCRNYILGGIPYYVWVGCPKKLALSSHSTSYSHEFVERLDAQVTESPPLHPVGCTQSLVRKAEKAGPELRSKAFDAAIVNLSTNVPLPSFFYQNHHWRIHYDDQLEKHTQFRNQYIYAFTWEDSRIDDRILRLGSEDVVLTITSAGDNVLSYALSSPARIHAVDLNPSQNNLLELKVAAFSALPYEDFWKLFGLGKHPEFRSILISRLSPHLSSRAFQYWLDNADTFTSKRGLGLYGTGGSRHAIRVFRVLTTLLGLRSEVKALIAAKTLNEQREIYQRKIRPVILSRILSYLIVGREKFLWAALGVPRNQLTMLQADHADNEAMSEARGIKPKGGPAVWEYMVQTIDPVVETILIGQDNPYYLVCLQSSYSQRCHPAYLSPKAHQKLSRPEAFDGLRIHTDDIHEVVARLTPDTLTVAVVMDSMDWFDPGSPAAAAQIEKLNNALKLGGRVLLRSAGLTPWYIERFENLGFQSKRVGARIGGLCIDRVNMYASCWLLTKVEHIPIEPEKLVL